MAPARTLRGLWFQAGSTPPPCTRVHLSTCHRPFHHCEEAPTNHPRYPQASMWSLHWSTDVVLHLSNPNTKSCQQNCLCVLSEQPEMMRHFKNVSWLNNHIRFHFVLQYSKVRNCRMSTKKKSRSYRAQNHSINACTSCCCSRATYTPISCNAECRQ